MFGTFYFLWYNLKKMRGTLSMKIDEQKLKVYLSKKCCRGCANRCPLDNPNCGRSKIFIRELIEKLECEDEYNEF